MYYLLIFDEHQKEYYLDGHSTDYDKLREQALSYADEPDWVIIEPSKTFISNHNETWKIWSKP